jgi:hypothetical protein
LFHVTSATQLNKSNLRMTFSAVSIGKVFYRKMIFPSDWQRCHLFKLAISCQGYLEVAANKALRALDNAGVGKRRNPFWGGGN